MELVDSILSYFINETNKPKEDQKTPEGLCPVCWGYQEYDGKLRKLFKDKQIDVNNHLDSYLLIQDFVKKNVDSLKLIEGEVESCPTCSKMKAVFNP
jgi:hypothetical protein